MVLGIANRTENWKTARCLWPFFGDGAIRLARRLGESEDTPAADVKLELYWKGVRDWCAEKNKRECAELLVESCRRLFPDLRRRIEDSAHFRDLGTNNYKIASDDQRAQLITNLANTEIDIVVASPERLYIGEAKFMSGFHASGKLVLVHQLVRQYVMANVLVDVVNSDRKVVPFVVTEATAKRSGSKTDADDQVPRSHQVRFLIDQNWMSAGNCLTWDDLTRLASEQSNAGVEV